MEGLKYPYYNDNSYLNLTVVRDVRGNKEYLSNCRKIDNAYYVKGVDLEFNGEKWVKKSNTVYDYELKKEVDSTYNLLHGVVEVSTTGTEKIGYFSPNPYKNCIINGRNGRVRCIDYNILSKDLYLENISDGAYYNMREHGIDKNAFSRKQIIMPMNHCPYNIEDNQQNFDIQKQNYAGSVFPIDRDIRFAANYIKDLTFGAEFETINGCLPDHLLNTYGLIICKDGSIKDSGGRYPPEYVTVPLQGAKGVQTLRNAAPEIAKRSDIDIKCSTHLHIGNIKPDRLFLVSLFKLCIKIQNDVFKMFPYYKTKPDGIKEKNYCKKLPNLLNAFNNGDFNKYVNDTYVDIYSFLSGGKKPDINLNKKTRVNPWGEGKWNIKTRYYWVNFVNLIFHKRETIEFRVHTPTLNSDKIVNWLFMCAAIIKYAQTYPQNCVSDKPIKFTEVLGYYSQIRSNVYAQKLSENLIQYYQERCDLFKKDYEAGDFVSQHDIKNDKKFSFNALKIN